MGNIFAHKPQYKASGNISSARVIMTSTGTSATCAQATGSTVALKPVGITKNRDKFPIGSYEDSAYPYIAVAGDAVDYWGEGEIAYAVVGTAVTRLDRPVVSDADGKLAPATPANSGTMNWAVGMPLDVGGAGEIIRVHVNIFPFLV